MSWWGGGEMRPTPGVECRGRAIQGETLWPGSSPPSPGLAPWAILICRSSAFTRYSLVTPKRPEATCLMALRRRSPLGSGEKGSGALAPLAGIGSPADPVHGDSQRLMGLGRYGPVRHGARAEPL